jgi:hypothetical protein
MRVEKDPVPTEGHHCHEATLDSCFVVGKCVRLCAETVASSELRTDEKEQLLNLPHIAHLVGFVADGLSPRQARDGLRHHREDNKDVKFAALS